MTTQERDALLVASLICLLVAGFMRGFTLPVMACLVLVFLLICRADFFALIPKKPEGHAPALTPEQAANLQTVGTLRQEFEIMKSKVSAHAIMLAVRSATKPKAASEEPADKV